MNLKNHKSGFLAGFMASTALLANDLVLFGNLQLNQLSILFLSAVSVVCFLGFVFSKKSKEQQV